MDLYEITLSTQVVGSFNWECHLIVCVCVCVAVPICKIMAAVKGGRKRQSPIWDFLEYDSETEASILLWMMAKCVKTHHSQIPPEKCTRTLWTDAVTYNVPWPAPLKKCKYMLGPRSPWRKPTIHLRNSWFPHVRWSEELAQHAGLGVKHWI